MQRLATILLTGLLLIVEPLPAQTTGTGQATVMPLSNELNANAMARVVTDQGNPAECLAPLAVTRIDGQAQVVSAKGFLIEPGRHTLNGRATLDLGYCPTGDPDLVISSVADLEVDFQAGVTYFIGFHHPPGKLNEWQLVVWNIESIPGGQ